jgi:cytochrome oxidase Cu insertion factor (SCO1/SenC/PrrC family)
LKRLEELVEEDIRYIKKYHKINDFSLINQNGKLISQEFYRNKIYIADFFFTTCPRETIKKKRRNVSLSSLKRL